jgi:redox-sensitive bicupin YhaK (pirin superfamily)
MTKIPSSTRRVVSRTRGQAHGPVTRLMSPSDLGEALKPFVFLDIFDLPDLSKATFGLHPHSGIATVTVFTAGDASFDDGEGNQGIIGYGGVEWMRAGRGVWHGQELGAGTTPGAKGFQLWLSLDSDLELSPPDSQYVEANCTPEVGPARVIVGRYAGETSPVRAPAGINYLLVRLKSGETWRYDTPKGHSVGWLAIAEGQVLLDGTASAGEMVVLDRSDQAIDVTATGSVDAVFVVGTAEPHRYPLYLGNYSVHTSAAMLQEGERHIAALRLKLIERERNRVAMSNGSVPILR